MFHTEPSRALRFSPPARLKPRLVLCLVALPLLWFSAAFSPAAADATEGELRVPFAAAPISQTEKPVKNDSKPRKNEPESVPVNVSAAQAARAARQEYGGKVLGVILEADARAPYYRVKLLDGGRVRVVHVAAHQ